MKTFKQLLFLLFFICNFFFSFSQVDWEMNEGGGIIPFDRNVLFDILGNQHGGSGAYEFANIPSFLDPGWKLAETDAKGDLYFEKNSLIGGFMAGLDFTYFRTSFLVGDPSKSFIVRFNKIDDGARAYVFNSNFPYAIPLNAENTFIPNGDARIFAPIQETDISPLLVQGENTLIIVQFDDSFIKNNLSVSLITEEEINSCLRDIKGPDIFVVLEDGTEVLLSNFTLDTIFECGAKPSLDLVVRDNCDPNASIVDAISGIESQTQDGLITYSASYTAEDASGNRSTFSYTYTQQTDIQGPDIFTPITNIPVFELDRCNEFVLNLEDLGISAVDNCTSVEDISITLSETIFESSGDKEVTITATDTLGNESTLDIKIRFTLAPNSVEITAGNDIISKTAAEDGSIILTEAELLANDVSSDGSPLEIQDLQLVNSTDGILNDNEDGTYTFIPSDTFSGSLMLTYIVKPLNSSIYFTETGHFYEYIPFNTSWDRAAAIAQSLQINNIEGYLATITSQSENDFIFNRIRGNGWIGASDAAVEGEWRWVAGPEGEMDNGKGLLFWVGTGKNGSGIDGVYSNWGNSKVAPAEPNNQGAENYAHFIFNLPEFFDEEEEGKWNDFRISRNLIDGFIVEYGSPEDCTFKFVDEAEVNVTIIINENLVRGTNKQYKAQEELVVLTPNPFRKQANLQVNLVEPSAISINIHDMSGKIIQTLEYEYMGVGRNDFTVSLDQYSPGVYFISVKTTTAQQKIKAILTD